jgi:quercetin dioxygenase-like cupin family protein
MENAKMSTGLKKLEDLIMGNHPKAVEYKGGTQGWALYKGDDAAVQRAFLPAGTVFEAHSHTVTEIVVVLSGRFQSTAALITSVTQQAGIIVFQPNMEHSHFAETDCWVLAALVPCNGGYPDAK